MISINRKYLKIITLICMTLDHAAFIFLTSGSLLFFFLRTAGRIVMPCMCLFLAEGFFYTSSLGKYFLRLLVSAVLSQFIYIFAINGKEHVLTTEIFCSYNVLFTLTLCFIMLFLMFRMKYKNTKIKRIALYIAIPAEIFLSCFCDSGCESLLWAYSFYKFRNDKLHCYFLYIVGCIIRVLRIADDSRLYTALGLSLFMPVYYIYDRRKKYENKIVNRLYYIYYPLHLGILGIVRLFV